MWDTCPDCTVIQHNEIKACQSLAGHLGGDEFNYYCKQNGANASAWTYLAKDFIRKLKMELEWIGGVLCWALVLCRWWRFPWGGIVHCKYLSCKFVTNLLLPSIHFIMIPRTVCRTSKSIEPNDLLQCLNKKNWHNKYSSQTTPLIQTTLWQPSYGKFSSRPSLHKI